jgi:predicted nucleotidyltransferase
MAMAAHGFVRATRDIDILVVAPAVRLPEVFALVREHGFAGEDRELVAALRERYVAELRSTAASVEILAPVLPYHHRVRERAVRLPVGGIEVPFVAPEDLVVLKMLWLRDKDRGDVRGLLAARRGRLDLDYVRRTLAEIVPAEDPRHGVLETMIRETAAP